MDLDVGKPCAVSVSAMASSEARPVTVHSSSIKFSDVSQIAEILWPFGSELSDGLADGVWI